jgi:hypothetical protein
MTYRKQHRLSGNALRVFSHPSRIANATAVYGFRRLAQRRPDWFKSKTGRAANFSTGGVFSKSPTHHSKTGGIDEISYRP